MIFILIRIAPGSPADKYISPQINIGLANEMKSVFGVDLPIYIQYMHFIKNAVSGDLGISFSRGLSVKSLIFNALPITLIIALMSFMLQIGLSFLFVFI